MSFKPLTISEFRDLINTGEASDPLVFLESVMTGHDPRELSEIYKLACEIQDFSNGEVSQEDWAELFNLICSKYKYHTVKLSESTQAARTLAEYVHAKRKSVEIKGGTEGDSVGSDALTEEEIKLFKEKFNEEF